MLLHVETTSQTMYIQAGDRVATLCTNAHTFVFHTTLMDQPDTVAHQCNKPTKPDEFRRL